MIIFKYLYKEYNSVYSNSQPFYKKLTCFLPGKLSDTNRKYIFAMNWRYLIIYEIEVRKILGKLLLTKKAADRKYQIMFIDKPSCRLL